MFRLRKDIATIERQTKVGNKTIYKALEGVSVTGYLKPLSKNNADIGVGRFGQTYTFNFPASSDIQMGDVLTINGKKYSVSTPPAPLTALRINVLECILELQNG